MCTQSELHRLAVNWRDEEAGNIGVDYPNSINMCTKAVVLVPFRSVGKV